MNNISRTRSLQWLAGGALLLFTSLSHAQWVWLDEKGLKQLSDRPPPSSVPLKRILKSPAGPNKSGVDAQSVQPAGTAAAASVPASAMSTADREADFRKRAKEKQEQQAKAEAEAAKAAQKQASCEAARNYKAQLDSGERIGVMRNGERTVMGDVERGQQQAMADKMMAACN